MPSTRTAPTNLRIPANDPEARLVRAVLGNSRLLNVLPPEVDRLFAAFTAAEAAAADARRLPVPADDLRSEVDADLRAGRSVDVNDLVARIGAAENARADREAALKLLGSLPGTFTIEIAQMIASHEDDYYAALSEDLDALLDRAEELAAALVGIKTADDAVDADLAAEWAELRRLAREYGALRDTHAALLRSSGDVNFSARKPALVRAMYEGIGAVFPQYLTETDGVKDVTGRTVSNAPFEPYATADPAHLLYVARHRDQLRPHVGHPDAAVVADEIPVTFGPRSAHVGPVAARHGGEANALHARFGSRSTPVGSRAAAQSEG